MRETWDVRLRARGVGRVLRQVTFALAVAAGALGAQNSPSLLDRPARLDVENVTIEVALRTLRRSSGVALAYSPDLLPEGRRVTCRCDKLTVGQALDRLLDGTGFRYQATPRQVLIVRASEEDERVGSSDRAQGVVHGEVILFPDSLPAAMARVTVVPAFAVGDDADHAAPIEVTTDRNGRFTLALVPGRYRLAAEALGARGDSEVDVTGVLGQPTRVTIHVDAGVFRLDEIVVAPSTFGMLTAKAPSAQLLTREELEAQPHPANDIARAVERLPGVSTTDYSAKPFLRGARADEVLTVLDGLELQEPYHIKYWDGSLSIVDMEDVSEVSLMTGGFTTEFGDKSAGVLAMRSADPPVGRRARTTVGLDFMSSILKSEGTFDEGKGAWLASARRGFLAFVFDLMDLYPDEDLEPSYYDLFSKVEYEVHPGHRVSVEVLHAGDDDHGRESDNTIYRIRYGNSYGWVNWDAHLNQALSVRTVASIERVTQDREGTDYWEPGDRPVLRVDDENTMHALGLRQDWLLRHSPRVMAKWGLDVRHEVADYGYFRSRFSYVPNLTDPAGPDFWPTDDTVTVVTSRSGLEVGAYLAGRFKPVEALTLEAGVRYDRQSYAGEEQVSPRFHLAWQLTRGTTLRGAWGHYSQPQGINGLSAADADTTFYPAQTAEHRILGFEHQFEGGYSLRLEAYQRLLSDPLPEYRRVPRNLEPLWEESLARRIFVRPQRGRAEGVELFVKSAPGHRLTWSGSYALAKSEENVDGDWVPRPYDQRHAVNLQVAFRPTPDWSIAASWIYHSPWPFTRVSFLPRETIHGAPYADTYVGLLNQGRLTTYKRVDFRASRRLRFGRSDVLLYVDVFNLLNRENAFDYQQDAIWTGSEWITRYELTPQLLIMPSLGLKWTF